MGPHIFPKHEGEKTKAKLSPAVSAPSPPPLGFSRNTSEGGLGEEETAFTSYVSDILNNSI